MGPGKVWIDDVRVYDVHFDRRTELLELSKLVTLVNVKLQRGEFSDCLRLLDGYWPRFLAAHVAPSPELIGRKTQQEAQKRTASQTNKPSKPGFADRLNSYLPRWMRF